MRYLTGFFFLVSSSWSSPDLQIVDVVIGGRRGRRWSSVAPGIVVVDHGRRGGRRSSSGTGVQVGLGFFTVVVVTGFLTGFFLGRLRADGERDRGVPAHPGPGRRATGAGRRSTCRSYSLVRG